MSADSYMLKGPLTIHIPYHSFWEGSARVWQLGLGTWGQAQPKKTTWSCPPVRAGHPDRWLRKMSFWTWNVISPVGREPELVQEVDRY